MAQICVTIGAPTLAALREARDRAAREADLVELRLDSLEAPEVPGALHGRTGPVIVTCRAAFEGGQFRGSEAERLALLHQAWALGAELVDVEFAAWSSARWVAAARGERLLVSTHDFTGVPADLAGRHRAMLATGASVVKVAATARRLGDVLALRQLAPPPDRRQVIVAMGAPGLVTRILPDLFGSAWTYAGDRWAPGQIPASRLRDEFRFGRLSASPSLYGVVARPSGHSVSPAIHNASFAGAGLDAVYLPLEAESADDFLAFAEGMGVRGASVTLPFKVDLLGRVEADPVARRAGAVNTIRRDGAAWVGTNTDVAGLLRPLAGRMKVRGRRAVILGAGGAARAAAVSLADAGAEVVVHARRPEAARAVAEAVGVGHAPMPPRAGSWDLLVNATPAGMHPDLDGTPWPDARFDGELVYDLIYNPRETRLLREARRAGCATLGGLGMLVAQAAAQFTYWTGQAADRDLMRAAAESRLEAYAAPSADVPTYPRT
jgi:3-dehydroquinate dehydratase / shikimate dehydrogenase